MNAAVAAALALVVARALHSPALAAVAARVPGHDSAFGLLLGRRTTTAREQ
jgi:hypothetical protein